MSKKLPEINRFGCVYQGDCLIEPDVKKGAKRESPTSLVLKLCVAAAAVFAYTESDTTGNKSELKKTIASRLTNYAAPFIGAGFIGARAAAISLIISLNYQGKLAAPCF
jgi:hypothetical protein